MKKAESRKIEIRLGRGRGGYRDTVDVCERF